MHKRWLVVSAAPVKLQIKDNKMESWGDGDVPMGFIQVSLH